MPHFWRITKRSNDKIRRGLAFFPCLSVMWHRNEWEKLFDTSSMRAAEG
jgi:hypothetical protein